MRQIIIGNQDARGYVEIDGQDISDLVRSVGYRHEAGSEPILTLELIALHVTFSTDHPDLEVLAQCFDPPGTSEIRARRIDRTKLSEVVSVLKEDKDTDRQ